MVNKYFGGNVPEYKGAVTEFDKDLQETIKKQIAEYEQNMDSYHISNALGNIWAIISRANKYIDETAPWGLAKSGEKEKLESCMVHLVETLRIIAILINPSMKETSNKIFAQLGIEKDEQKQYDTIYNFGNNINSLKVIEKGEPIFVRLDQAEEIEFIKNKMKNS